MTNLGFGVSAGAKATLSALRAKLRHILESPYAAGFITSVILINAVVLGLETWPAAMNAAGPALLLADQIALSIFVVELTLKIFAFGPGFFRKGWNLFDFALVSLALLPATHSFSALRALRILRAFRLISTIPQLRRVVESLLSALPGMGAVMVLLALVFYVSAVLATKMFAAEFPEWFGSIGASLYSLFQIMTLESWSMGIVRPVMQEYPWAWAFFVPFIVVTSLTVLNLFIALIVSALQEQDTSRSVPHENAGREDGLKQDIEALSVKVSELQEEIAKMRLQLDGSGSGTS